MGCLRQGQAYGQSKAHRYLVRNIRFSYSEEKNQTLEDQPNSTHFTKRKMVEINFLVALCNFEGYNYFDVVDIANILSKC